MPARQSNATVGKTSRHQIIITEGLYSFLNSYNDDFKDLSNLQQIMSELEKDGVFMNRKSSDLGSVHMNEAWYEARINELPFTGENKHEIDW
jgi:hypothetical protein